MTCSVRADAAESHRLPAQRHCPSFDDELLPGVRAAAHGDKAAVRRLMLAVARPMLQTIRGVLGHHHPDAEDVAQEASVVLFQLLPAFRAECPVVAFAQRIARLRALTRRRNGQQQAGEAVSIDDLVEDRAPEPDRSLAIKRLRVALASALERLPPSVAEAMVLHFAMGNTVEEVAHLTNAPANTVWTRLRTGKKAIRDVIAADPELAERLRAGAETPIYS